ncbi:MAG: thioredoxin [Acidobacteria bacterium]|nr:MAG: thioredoxin [Acidobacteriota bacterium]
MKTAYMKAPLYLGLVLACSICGFGRDRADDNTHDDQPVAVVSGEPIYKRDLAATTATQMLQVHRQQYKIESQALDELIRQKLVEDEAKKQGISSDKLYEKEVDSKINDPSDAEVEGYYLAVKSQVNQPFEDVRAQLRKVVKALKTEQARQEYADSLRAKAEVEVLLEPPKVEVGYDPTRVRGNPAAPVTIVEFSDFQCPYCKKVTATLNDLLAKYQGRVKLGYRDFPMRQLHPHAEIAAEAGRCAEEQGKFWEYHDALFADQTKLDEAGLEATAQKLGLDEKSFQSCLASGKFKAQVEQDVQDGSKAGVSGTPGFFINGVFVNGSQPQGEFEKVINRELAAAGSMRSTRASR